MREESQSTFSIHKMSDKLPSIDNLPESELPSVDQFITEEQELPSIDEFVEKEEEVIEEKSCGEG